MLRAPGRSHSNHSLCLLLVLFLGEHRPLCLNDQGLCWIVRSWISRGGLFVGSSFPIHCAPRNTVEDLVVLPRIVVTSLPGIVRNWPAKSEKGMSTVWRASINPVLVSRFLPSCDCNQFRHLPSGSGRHLHYIGTLPGATSLRLS